MVFRKLWTRGALEFLDPFQDLSPELVFGWRSHRELWDWMLGFEWSSTFTDQVGGTHPTAPNRRYESAEILSRCLQVCVLMWIAMDWSSSDHESLELLRSCAAYLCDDDEDDDDDDDDDDDYYYYYFDDDADDDDNEEEEEEDEDDDEEDLMTQPWYLPAVDSFCKVERPPTGPKNVMRRLVSAELGLVFGDRRDRHTGHCVSLGKCECCILPGAFFAVLGYLIFGPGLINWENFDAKWEEQDDRHGMKYSSYNEMQCNNRNFFWPHLWYVTMVKAQTSSPTFCFHCLKVARLDLHDPGGYGTTDALEGIYSEFLCSWLCQCTVDLRCNVFFKTAIR